MQSVFLKVIFICLLASFFANRVEAQLLHEINKLKTEKRKTNGFRIFKKQVRRGSGKPQITSVGSPRFTKASKNSRYNVSTRFSQNIDVKERFKVKPPRFSQDIAGQGFKKFAKPRFSIEPDNFEGKNKPRAKTVSHEGMVFSFQRAYKASKIRNNGDNNYNPKYSDKSKKHGRDFHPSAAYRSAKYQNSKLLRKGMQKFNILLVRVHGNKTQPNGVNKKSKKLKNDRHESEIWNNKEREYSHN